MPAPALAQVTVLQSGAQTYQGSSTMALTFGATETGTLGAFSSSTAAFTFGATDTGTLGTFSSSTASFVFTATDTGTLGAFTSSTAAFVFGATDSAYVGIFATSTVPIVVTITTTPFSTVVASPGGDDAWMRAYQQAQQLERPKPWKPVSKVVAGAHSLRIYAAVDTDGTVTRLEDIFRDLILADDLARELELV